MIRWKLVVPHAIIQINLLSCIYYVLLHALMLCKPSAPLVVDDNVLMVLAGATALLTFPVGWLAMLVCVAVGYPLLSIAGAMMTSLANALLWDKFLQVCRRFWERFEQKQNRCRVLKGERS